MLNGVDIRIAFVGSKEEMQELSGTLRQKRFGECLPEAAGDREDRQAKLISVAAGDVLEGIAQ